MIYCNESGFIAYILKSCFSEKKDFGFKLSECVVQHLTVVSTLNCQINFRHAENTITTACLVVGQTIIIIIIIILFIPGSYKCSNRNCTSVFKGNQEIDCDDPVIGRTKTQLSSCRLIHLAV